MQSKRTQATRHLSLVSTPIASEILEHAAATDWVACSECAQEYRPRVLVSGVCDRCRDEASRIQTRMAEVFKVGGVTSKKLIRMAEEKFDTGENSRAYIAARDFDPMRENLYLFGGVGLGKTMLACKVIRQAIAKRIGCAFVVSDEWVRSLYGASGLDQQTSISALVNSRVLVVDELGSEPGTEFSVRMLYNIVNARMLGEQNGMVVTSNYSLDQLAKRLDDDRIASRLGGMCKVIELQGNDYRQRD